MSLVLALIGGAVYAACGIGRFVRNEDFKRYTSKIDEQGRLSYMDCKGNRYINGEKLIDIYDRETNSITRIGKYSGTIYDSQELRVIEHNRKNRELAIADGRLAYPHWDAKRKCCLTVEISTGKVIYSLTEYKNKCFKRYATEASLMNYNSISLEPCEEKIEISREESYKLHVPGGSDVVTNMNMFY